jgi:type I restriction enzyme R subunit
MIDQREKTIVFCATQDHALAVRDLINQMKTSSDPEYCVRVTANDGALGDQALREFQDNEKTIPTILTTSQKLSTGVDARNVRNIVLMRPGQFDDRVQADHRTWHPPVRRQGLLHDLRLCEGPPPFQRPGMGWRAKKKTKAKIKLADGKERDPFPRRLEALFGKLPEFFADEDELRALWSDPGTRRKLLDGLDEKGFGREQLAEMQKVIDAENSDIFDVLAYVAYAQEPLTREERAARAKAVIDAKFNSRQQAFLTFVLSHYVEEGVEELDQAKLTPLLKLRYHDSMKDALDDLGQPEEIRRVFSGFQKYLYEERV